MKDVFLMNKKLNCQKKRKINKLLKTKINKIAIFQVQPDWMIKFLLYSLYTGYSVYFWLSMMIIFVFPCVERLGYDICFLCLIYFFAVCIGFLKKVSQTFTDSEKSNPKSIETRFKEACLSSKGNFFITFILVVILYIFI